MSLALLQNLTAIAPKVQTPFSATGGTPPYTFSVLPGGAGGTIDPSSGLYTAPQAVNNGPDPALSQDTIQVTDSLAAQAQAVINVCSPLMLVRDIIVSEMGLSDDQAWLYQQKFDVPSDSRLYVSIGVLSNKPFGKSTRTGADGESADQSANWAATLSIDIFSRSTEALNRKEELILALNSLYAQTQQEANGFYIAKLPTAFVNVTDEEGSALVYHFNMSLVVQYSVTKSKPVAYYDDFPDVETITDP